MTDARRPIPAPPLLLGGAGLIPFIGLALVAVLGGWPALGFDAAAARGALAAYGAVIASFLGGIRWGLAMGSPGPERSLRDYALAVVPSLIAWAALALADPWRLAALTLLVGAWGLVDQDLPRRGLAPAWFAPLRLTLSTGAGLALLAGAWSA